MTGNRSVVLAGCGNMGFAMLQGWLASHVLKTQDAYVVEPNDGLRERALMVRSQGYRGMLAIHPAQVPVINQAFTPSEAELDKARAVIAAFAANPGAGTVGVDGAMLDRPHLALAHALLASAED